MEDAYVAFLKQKGQAEQVSKVANLCWKTQVCVIIGVTRLCDSLCDKLNDTTSVGKLIATSRTRLNSRQECSNMLVLFTHTNLTLSTCVRGESTEDNRLSCVQIWGRGSGHTTSSLFDKTKNSHNYFVPCSQVYKRLNVCNCV